MDYSAWRKEQQKNSEIMLRAYHQYAADAKDDVLGSSILVEELWDDAGCLGLSLSGPNGCGKHTAAAFLIDSIRRKSKDCAFLFLDGDNLDAADALTEKLSAFLDDCYDGVDPEGARAETGESIDACILIDNLLRMQERSELMRFIMNAMLEYRMAEDYPRLFFVFLSKEPVPLPGVIQNMVRSVRFSLPTPTQRRYICESVMYGLALHEKISTEKMAELTEGLSYLQIRNAVAGANRLMEDMETDMLEAFVRSQAPLRQEDMQRERFYQRISDLVQRLADRPAVATTVVAAAQPAESAQPADTAQRVEAAIEAQQNTPRLQSEAELAAERRSYLESLPPDSMLADVFGVERKERLRLACEKRCAEALEN